MQQNLSNKRNDIYDVMRGILMILVVMGHCGAPFTKEIYSFHVPAFFFLSGLLYKRKIFNIQNFIDVFKKRIKRLYLPYLGFALFFTILYTPFLNLGLYVTQDALFEFPDIPHSSIASSVSVFVWIKNIVKSFLFSGGTQLCGAIWFLRVLFISSIVIDLECYLFRNIRDFNKIFIPLNILLATLGIICSIFNIQLPLNFDTVLTVLIFYIAGYFSKTKIIKLSTYLMHNKISYSIVLIILCTVLIYILSENMNVNVGANQYSNIISLMISSLLGIILTFSAATVFHRYNPLKLFFLMVGQNTIAILGWHFLSFKLVTLCIIKFTDISMAYLGAFPILDPTIWPIYTVCGVIVPIILNYILSACAKEFRISIINKVLIK